MSNPKKERLDPSTPSRAYRRMAPTWDKIQAVLDGTESLRGRGQQFLPMHENESHRAYDERLRRSTLLNMTELTLNTWVGRPFSEAMKTSDDMSETFQDWLTNVDLQGNNLTTFARAWMREGLAKLYSHVLIDFPTPDRPLTNAAEGEGLRPFMSHIPPENLLFGAVRNVDGQEVLVHARIFEQEMVQDGFTEFPVDRIRIFDRVLENEPREISGELIEAPGVYVSTWIHVKQKSKDEWIPESPPFLLGIEQIPIVTYYSMPRQGFMFGKTPLEDLVDLNINWWQSNSDQNSILTVARFPILAETGVPSGDNVLQEVGPNVQFSSTNPQAKFYYVEHTGAAIESGRMHLLDLEEQMGHYGAEFMKRKQEQTATARMLNGSESVSSLEAATIAFEGVLNRAVKIMGMWVGEPEPGTITMNVDFAPDSVDPADLQALAAARADRDISGPTRIRELVRRNVLSVDFDPEQNATELEEEDATFGGAPTDGNDIDPLSED